MKTSEVKHSISTRKTLAAAIIAALLTVVMAAALLPAPAEYDGPVFDDVRAAHRRSESVLLDRNGRVLHELRTDDQGRRLDWVGLDEISPALPAAVIAAEDRRFYRHHGVDWKAIAAAAAGVFRRETRGASTITMQLAARLDTGLHPAALHRTWRQKFRQLRSARSLERTWTKRQILEAYLNLISFRGELQGLAAAAGGLFDKNVHGLTDVESVILAALVRAPNAATGRVIERACSLAGAMDLPIDCSEISGRAEASLNRTYFIRPKETLAYHVAQLLLTGTKTGGDAASRRVVSALDYELQVFVDETLRRHIAAVGARNVRDGAALVLDNRTGDVLAYVGNTGSDGSARYVDGIRALRQAGSTLKPFIYGIALDRRLLTAASLIDDGPVDIPVAGGVYRPVNYDNLFYGPVSVRQALASSLNVPAVLALDLVGIDSALAVLAAAGFEKLRTADYYGPSLALGSADISLLELANAYRSLANGGIWTPVNFTPDRETGPPRPVLSPQAAFIVADILSDRESRSLTFSLESPLATRFRTAVKTGTSTDMRDNWCIGFSDRYTVGVWAGNFSGEPMWNVSGISGAAPVWVEIMNRLHREEDAGAPKPPDDVVAGDIPGTAGRSEWFIRGTEQSLLPGRAQTGARIVYPAPDTIFALDPDIPGEGQKLFFEARPGDSSLEWKLNGDRIGTAGSLVLWTPVPGKHLLVLVDEHDRAVDSVAFEVRGSR
ncbi:MAG TPA: penicillin-binding protein 1C [Acidobacteriota bacterium]|nr:penicillin-binding protein 1C [Acidobacteriota bacterium]